MELVVGNAAFLGWNSINFIGAVSGCNNSINIIMKTKTKTRKQFQKLVKNSRPLTSKKIQELRKKAIIYAENGGLYLSKQETKAIL